MVRFVVYNGDLFGRYIDEELHEAYLYYIREPVCTTASAVEAFLDRQQELLSERLRNMKKRSIEVILFFGFSRFAFPTEIERV